MKISVQIETDGKVYTLDGIAPDYMSADQVRRDLLRGTIIWTMARLPEPKP